MALPLAGVIAAAIAGVLALKTVQFLITLGFAWAAYSGLDTFVTYVKGQLETQFAAAGTVVVDLVAVLNIDRAFNIIFAAYLARLVLRGMRGGVIQRWQTTGVLGGAP